MVTLGRAVTAAAAGGKAARYAAADPEEGGELAKGEEDAVTLRSGQAEGPGAPLRRFLRAACHALLCVAVPFPLGVATERYLLRPKVLSVNCAGGAGGNGTQALAPTPASYGFVYTEEGITIADGLVSIASATGGPKAALEKAEGLLRSSRHFLDACHPMMHRFGRALYTNGGENGFVAAFQQLIPFSDAMRDEAAALIKGTAAQPAPGAAASTAAPEVGTREIDLLMTCNAAYLHGIVERFLGIVGMRGNLSGGMDFVERAICQRLGSDFRPPWECRHGIGHGVVQFQRMTSTHRAIKDALEASAATTHPVDLWNGIWMDHFASTSVAGHDADDAAMALGVCSDADLGLRRGRGDCEMYAPTAFLLHRPRAYVEAFRWCEDGCSFAPSGGDCLGTCTMGVGMQTFKENLDDLGIVGRVCSKAKDWQLTKRCLGGAKSYHVFATGKAVSVLQCNQIEGLQLRLFCIGGG